MKALYFMLKVLFLLEIFTFLCRVFDYEENRLNQKDMVNFKVYDVTNWKINNYNANISQTLKKQKHTD